jgi:hypothetical protein
MKNTMLYVAAALAFVLACPQILDAQKTNTWKGGTPGRAADWYCSTNWSNGAVPNEFSNVVVPDVSTTTQAPPVLKAGRVEINALVLESGAHLTVGTSAQLTIFDYVEGVSTASMCRDGKVHFPGELPEKKMSDPYLVRAW